MTLQIDWWFWMWVAIGVTLFWGGVFLRDWWRKRRCPNCGGPQNPEAWKGRSIRWPGTPIRICMRCGCNWA